MSTVSLTENLPLFTSVYVTWSALSLWLAQIGFVLSYSDLRGTKCMTPYLKATLPSARSVWGGTIHLTMECDPGYDFALNTPPGGVFSCRPDGSSWSPDYIPDCNKLIRPSQIYYVMVVPLNDACASLGRAYIKNDSILFQSNSVLNIRRLCGAINPASSKCSVDKAEMHCGGSQTLDRHGGDLTTSLPSMYVKIRSRFSDKFDLERFKTTASNVLAFLEPPLNISSDVLSALRVDCPPGTVGLVDGRSGIVCRGCSLGHFLMAEKTTCSPCPPGYYSDTPMSVACKTCPALVGVTGPSRTTDFASKARSRSYSISMCPVLTNVDWLTSDVVDQRSNKTAASMTKSKADQLTPQFVVGIVAVTLTVLTLVAVLSAVAELMVARMKKTDATKKPIPPSPSGACFTSPMSSSQSLANVSSRLTSVEENRSVAIRAISRGMDGLDMTVNYVP